MMRILLVEDNLKFVKLIHYFIEEENDQFQITHAHNLQEALHFLENQEFDVVVLDMYLPDSQGIQSINRLKEKKMNRPIVFLTSLDDPDIRNEAFRNGAGGYLLKDQIVNHFIPTLRNAIQSSQSS
ncbi:MAG: response regulator [Candidatus Omnitrophica bacterium]|nr:response regulator [Candidatus Omnitrophota bacterium]